MVVGNFKDLQIYKIKQYGVLSISLSESPKINAI